MLIKFTTTKQWLLAVLITACLLLAACNTNRYRNTTIEFSDGSVDLHVTLPMSVHLQRLSDHEVQVCHKKEPIGRIVLEDTAQTGSTPEEAIGAILGDGKDCWEVTEEYSLPGQYAQSSYLFSRGDGRIGILASRGNLCVVTELSADSLSADEMSTLIGSMVIEA